MTDFQLAAACVLGVTLALFALPHLVLAWAEYEINQRDRQTIPTGKELH